MRRNSQDLVGKYQDRAVICALHSDVFTSQLKREMLEHYYQSKDLEVTFQWVREKLRKEDADKMKMLVKEEQKKQKELEQNEVCL